MPQETSRRRFASIAGLGALGALAGCSQASLRDENGAVTGSVTDRTDAPTESGATRSRTTPESTTTSPGRTAEPDATAEPGTTSAQDEVVRHDHQTATPDFSDETLARARELGHTVQRSVVKLTAQSGGGTGWVIEDGYIVTNSHVTRDFETMDVETFDGRSGTATRVGYHEDMFPDIALLKTDMETPAPLPMETNTGITAGDPVLAVGHPGRVGDWVISLGRYDTYKPGVNWELSDIPTSQGNSGSPIVTLDGVVFGCISGTTTANGRPSRLNRSENVYTEFPVQERLATASPSKTIEKWVDEWQ